MISINLWRESNIADAEPTMSKSIRDKLMQITVDYTRHSLRFAYKYVLKPLFIIAILIFIMTKIHDNVSAII